MARQDSSGEFREFENHGPVTNRPNNRGIHLDHPPMPRLPPLFDSGATSRRDKVFHFHVFPPSNVSIFFRVASSILMSGGHARLKPSPGSFFVASMPEIS